MKKISMLLVAIMLYFTSYTIGIAQDDYILDVEYYPPSVESGNVAIMFLGGSEGGILDFSVEPYTAKGYPFIKVGYFGTEHTPDRLDMIPLEYFEKAIEMFKSQPEVKGKKIVVLGGSKGGELALLLASRYKEIEGVIAKVPGSVVFQGAGTSSSWSYKGQPVPYVPFYEPFDKSKVVHPHWREWFELSLTQIDAVEKAVIRVEQINGPILIITGQEDILWPSNQMGDMMVKRLKDHNFPHWYKHYAYENAGHSLTEHFLIGGTKDGNKKAGIDSEKRIFEFLRRLSGADEQQNQHTAKRFAPQALITLEDKIDVGGYKLNICCYGEGKPAVIVDAGKGEPAIESGSWTAVVSAIAQTTQVCLYNRAGLGSSDRAPEQDPSGRTTQDMVKDLHTLLEKAGIPAPYILVGHSIGGYNVRLYASQYPKEVAGMVLVDSTHPDIFSKFYAALPPERPDDSEGLRAVRDQWLKYSAALSPERPDESGSLRAVRSMEDRFDPKDPEKMDFATSGAQLRATGLLGDLPLVVITCAPGTNFFPFLPTDLSDKLMQIWQEMQIDLEGLSSNSTHIIADHAGHYIQPEEPQLVIDAILKVMGQVKKQ